MTPPHLTHPSLAVSHGFFGRRGGVSDAPYDCLNCGLGSEDNPDHVHENLNRVRKALGADRLLTLSQVHSDRFIHAEDFDDWGDTPIEADGFVCRTPGVAIAALSADCAPVLFHDPIANVIGACHAGWRGAVGGILDTTLDGLFSLGATAETLRMVVGPCISLESYEVGRDFAKTVQDQDPEGRDFFSNSPSKTASERPWIGDGVHFNLPNYVLSRAARRGVKGSNVDLCTYAAPQAFFSYRYNTHNNIADYGRNISAIVLLG